MLTVGSLVSDCGLELIAGADGAERPIRWVHISEIEDPTPWLSGGELLLTTGIQLSSAAPGKVLDGDNKVVVDQLPGPGPWTANIRRGLFKYVVPGGGTALFEVTGGLDANGQPVVIRVAA